MTIGEETYVVLTTFTKDGRAKPTPIWVVEFDGALAVWTAKDAWKAKRVRNSGRVQVQGSDLRGRVTHGPLYEGVGELLGAEESGRVVDAINRKYGLIGRLTTLGSRLRRGRDGTVAIRLDVEPI